jgi:hypothetical protein
MSRVEIAVNPDVNEHGVGFRAALILLSVVGPYVDSSQSDREYA